MNTSVMKKRYAVLGGGGSFAIHTSLYLLDYTNAEMVVGVGRNDLPSEPFSLGINENYDSYKYVRYHVVSEIDELLNFLDRYRPHVIVNFAAQGEGALSWTDSWRFFETNCVGLSRLVEGLIGKDWLERFIHIGSSEVYGSVVHPVDESAPIRPTSPYAASKAAFDLYLQSVHAVYGFPMTILRPCNAYCPGQRLHRVIPRAIWSGLTGRKLPLQGGGKVLKSYTHAFDLARAVYRAEITPPGRIYNVGSKEPIAIRDLVQACADALEMPFDELVEEVPDRVSQDAVYWLDSSAFFNDTNWCPVVNLRDGLIEMVQWGGAYLHEIRDLDPTYTVTP